MAGGGHIILRNAIAPVASMGTVQDQLGPMKLAKLETILSTPTADWSFPETYFVIKCIRDALEAYE